MKDITQCACGIAQDDCDYHKEVLGQPDFKLRWTERDYKAIRSWEDVMNAATIAELELAKNVLADTLGITKEQFDETYELFEVDRK